MENRVGKVIEVKRERLYLELLALFCVLGLLDAGLTGYALSSGLFSEANGLLALAGSWWLWIKFPVTVGVVVWLVFRPRWFVLGALTAGMVMVVFWNFFSIWSVLWK